MNNVSLRIEVGDIIGINGLGYKHVGVYVGAQQFQNHCVVHNVKGGGVVLSTLVQFAAGSPFYIEQKATGNYFEREEIARRALSLIGTKYDLINFNCEHAANLAQTGEAKSPQLAVAGLAIIAVVGLAILAGSEA